MTASMSRLSRVLALRFKPRILLRSEPGHDLRRFGPGVVIRYGVMPDGYEVALGRTVDQNLSEATDHYWAWLFETSELKRVPRAFRWLVKRLWKVEVKGYEMTPLPARKVT